MARIARLVVPGVPHHITLRANNRRRLFSFSTDFLRFLALVRRAAVRFACPVHAYCLMTNHVHLIVTPPSVESLARFVKDFAQRYATYWNRKRDGSGKLFEQRFDSRLITSDEQLAACTAYDELHPVKAGLTRAPGDYRWSSYRFHASSTAPLGARGLLTPSVWYLSLGSCSEARAAAFREYLENVRELRERPGVAPPRPRASKRRLRRPDGSRAS